MSLPEAPPLTRGDREGADGWSPRASYLGFGLLVAAAVGTVLFATAPAPYVVERPGPVFDTLGVVPDDGEEVPLLDISGEETYPTSGRLDLLTVYISGSRENPLSWLDIAEAWFDPSRTVLPVDAVYPAGQTEDEADEESAAAMDYSQQEAVAAALAELGYEFDSVVLVAGLVEGGPSEGVLEPGDELLTLDGEPLPDADALRAALAAAGAGEPVELGIRRDGVERTVSVVPATSDAGAVVIGIYPGARYEFPFDVEIRLRNVGGPSAGMMFALGIIDKVTPGELTAGEHIAGTGTISATGQVGAIGGIVQKMHGADRAGADWFLAPRANCAEVAGRIPGDLEVFAVGDLDEAIATVEAIAAGDTSGLARCTG